MVIQYPEDEIRESGLIGQGNLAFNLSVSLARDTIFATVVRYFSILAEASLSFTVPMDDFEGS